MINETHLSNLSLVLYAGGLDYMIQYWYIYLPYILLYIVSATLNVIGRQTKLCRYPTVDIKNNYTSLYLQGQALVIGSILTDSVLRTNTTFIIITNLAISELLVGLVNIPLSIFGNKLKALF